MIGTMWEKWRMLVQAGKLREAVLEYLRANVEVEGRGAHWIPGVRFDELLDAFALYADVRGDVPFGSLKKNVLLWDGLSRSFADLLLDLTRTGDIYFAPVQSIAYLYRSFSDAKTDTSAKLPERLKKLPMASELPSRTGYKYLVWLPVTLQAKKKSELPLLFHPSVDMITEFLLDKDAMKADGLLDDPALLVGKVSHRIRVPDSWIRSEASLQRRKERFGFPIEAEAETLRDKLLARILSYKFVDTVEIDTDERGFDVWVYFDKELGVTDYAGYGQGESEEDALAAAIMLLCLEYGMLPDGTPGDIEIMCDLDDIEEQETKFAACKCGVPYHLHKLSIDLELAGVTVHLVDGFDFLCPACGEVIEQQSPGKIDGVEWEE